MDVRKLFAILVLVSFGLNAHATSQGYRCSVVSKVAAFKPKAKPKSVSMSVSGTIWINIEESDGKSVQLSPEGESKVTEDGTIMTSATLLKESKEIIVFFDRGDNGPKTAKSPMPTYSLLMPERGLLYTCVH